MSGDSLTEIEQHLLWEIIRLRHDATGSMIWSDYCDRTNKDVAIGQVYSTLDRMERKGFVTSELHSVIGADGKNRKVRYFTPTESGKTALQNVRNTWNSLTKGLSLA